MKDAFVTGKILSKTPHERTAGEETIRYFDLLVEVDQPRKVGSMIVEQQTLVRVTEDLNSEELTAGKTAVFFGPEVSIRDASKPVKDAIKVIQAKMTEFGEDEELVSALMLLSKPTTNLVQADRVQLVS